MHGGPFKGRQLLTCGTLVSPAGCVQIGIRMQHAFMIRISWRKNDARVHATCDGRAPPQVQGRGFHPRCVFGLTFETLHPQGNHRLCTFSACMHKKEGVCLHEACFSRCTVHKHPLHCTQASTALYASIHCTVRKHPLHCTQASTGEIECRHCLFTYVLHIMAHMPYTDVHVCRTCTRCIWHPCLST